MKNSVNRVIVRQDRRVTVLSMPDFVFDHIIYPPYSERTGSFCNMDTAGEHRDTSNLFWNHIQKRVDPEMRHEFRYALYAV
jgi:hypothetical protein